MAAPPAVADGLYRQFDVSELKQFHTLSAFLQLRQILIGAANDAQRSRIALALAIRAGVVPGTAWDEVSFAKVMESAAGSELQALPAFATKANADLGRVWTSTPAQLQIAIQIRRADLQTLPGSVGDASLQPLALVRWSAEHVVTDADSKRLWQQLWHAANLLLPAANTWIAADRGCALAPLAAAPAYAPRQRGSAEWVEACELAHPSLAAMLSRLAGSGVSAPTVGFELLDASGRVACEAELAWVAHRIAVVLTGDSVGPLATAGWRVFLAGTDGFEEALRVALFDTAKE